MSTEAEKESAYWREWNERARADQRKRWAKEDEAERNLKWMPLKITGFMVLAVLYPVAIAVSTLAGARALGLLR